MAILNPYIQFTDSAAAAGDFYQSVLGGEMSRFTFADMGMEGPNAHLVMHSNLTTDAGFTLMLADCPPEMGTISATTNIQISLSGNEDALLRGYWDGLSAGGRINTPLELQMWGDVYGQFTDKFGIEWMVNISPAE